MEFFLTGVVILSAVVSLGTACPTECSCTYYSYNSNDVYVDCSDKNLGYIPTNLPNTTYQLLLYRNKIKTLEENSFVNLTNLYYLDLGNNEISLIKENAFVNLPGLRCLYFYNNNINITVFDPQMTRSMPNVVYLDLSNNNILVIKENAFVNLHGLRALYLRNNNITVLDPKMIRSMPYLNALVLGDNKIRTLEENTFVNLTNLDQLELSNNEISLIKENAFVNLPGMSRLILSNNNITVLDPKMTRSMPNLRELMLDGNKIKTLEENSFVNLTNLEQLFLAKNEISVIKENAFVNLPSLWYLDLTSNPLICNCSILPFWTWLTIQRSGVAARCSNGTYVVNIASSALDNCNDTVNGQWSNWGSWAACSMTCRNGTQYRNRSCNNPTPANGGSDCQGLNYETLSCNNGACPESTCQCYNGGICTVGSDGQSLCTCVGKWKGEKCLESQCLSYDCGKDSCYVEPVNGSAKCFPKSGFCPRF